MGTNTFIKASTKPIARPFHISPSEEDDELSIKLTTSCANILEEPRAKGFNVFDNRLSCGPITSRAPVMKLINSMSSSRPIDRTMENSLENSALSPLPST